MLICAGILHKEITFYANPELFEHKLNMFNFFRLYFQNLKLLVRIKQKLDSLKHKHQYGIKMQSVDIIIVKLKDTFNAHCIILIIEVRILWKIIFYVLYLYRKTKHHLYGQSYMLSITTLKCI